MSDMLLIIAVTVLATLFVSWVLSVALEVAMAVVESKATDIDAEWIETEEFE